MDHRIIRSMSPTSQSLAIGSFSQLAGFHNHAVGPASNAPLGIMPTAAEDIIKLKKELRLKQAEFDKERAILMQKNEQLDASLKETALRQQAQVQMYETMINSLKQPESTSSSLIVAQIEASERHGYEDQIAELRDWKRRQIDSLDDKDRDFTRQISDKDVFIKDLQIQVERMLLEKSQQLFQWDVERKDMISRLQYAASDKEQAEAIIELKCQTRISESQMELEKLKLGHMREVEKIKHSYENAIQDVRMLHEQEKQTLEGRLDRQSHDLKSLHHMVIQQDSATTDTKQSTKQHREQLNQEIGQITAEVEVIRQQHEKTVAELTKEKELADARNDKLQKQLEKLKNAPKQPAQVLIDLPFKNARSDNGAQQNSHDDTSLDLEAYQSLQRQLRNQKQEIELLQGENEKLGDQVKRLRKEAIEMQEYAERLEGNEKKLRKVLEDQASIEQEQVVELRRILNNEKKRALDQQEVLSQAKETLERENHRQVTQIYDKEEQIRNLTSELRSHEKKLLDIQAMFNQSQIAGETMSVAAMTENQMMLHQRQISGTPLQSYGLHYIAQSQANFSPRGLGNGMQTGGVVHQSQSNNLNHSMQLPHLYQNQSFVSHHVEGGVIYNQVPQNQDHYVQDSSYAAGPYKQMTSQSFLVQSTVQPRSPQIVTQRSIDGAFDHNAGGQPKPQGLITAQSPKAAGKMMPGQFGSNSRSFTCLLKEIDEEDEKHLKRSIPQEQTQVVALKDSSDVSLRYQKDSEAGIPRKSRNTNNMVSSSSVAKLNTNQGGMMVKRPSTSSLISSNSVKIHQSQHSNHTKFSVVKENTSVTSAPKSKGGPSSTNSNNYKPVLSKSKSKKSLQKEKSSSSITNEIKDLLDRLVTYQGNQHSQSVCQQPSQSTRSLHSQSVLTAQAQNEIPKVQRHHLGNTESMVELRSSIASSSIADTRDNIDFRAHTTRHHYEYEMKVSKDSQRSGDTAANKQKPSQNGLQLKSKVGAYVPNHTQGIDFEKILVSEKQSARAHEFSYRSDSSGAASSGERNCYPRPSCQTAKHTSKDTIMSIPGMSSKGRRYHEVNKSDVITPNSPRRYQEYFKSYQQKGATAGSQNFPFHNNSLMVGSSQQQSSKPQLNLTASRPIQKSQKYAQENNYQNHRYSPSNTKSLADESQYNQQLSPSPEKKQSSKVHQYLLQEDTRTIGSNAGMPLQNATNNQAYHGAKLSGNKQPFYGTYDSGSVLIGAASDAAIFKTHGSNPYAHGGYQHQGNLMFGGGAPSNNGVFCFQPGATVSTIKTTSNNQGEVRNFNDIIANAENNSSMEEDADIRPSQIDEFIEMRAAQKKKHTSHQNKQQNADSMLHGMGPTSSYITIGDDDPFITGKFCDAQTKQINFKSAANHSKADQMPFRA